jgi:tetratricopeptide (TPR) repeat protein
VDWTVHALRYVRDHFKKILWVAGITVAVFIVVIAINRINSYRMNNAEKVLLAAHNFAPGSAERQKALEALAADYGSTPAGREATMALGDELFARADFYAAVTQYENLVKSAKRLPLMEVAALHKLAKAQRATGRTEDAAKTYLTAAENTGNLNRADSFYQAGFCYEELKNYNEALRLYQRVLDSGAEGDIRSKSEERILWLMANGVVSS